MKLTDGMKAELRNEKTKVEARNEHLQGRRLQRVVQMYMAEYANEKGWKSTTHIDPVMDEIRAIAAE